MMARPDFTTFPPTRNFDLIVTVGDNDSRLRSGMSATARIELERMNDVLVVPAAAVFQHGDGPVAYVVNGSGVEAHLLKVLRRGRDQVAIASGVREGDRIALKEPEETAR